MKISVAKYLTISTVVGGFVFSLIAGCGGSSGAARPGGTGGATGAAGAAGTNGAGGATAAGGATGAGGAATCPSSGLNCAAAVTPNALVTDFSPATWMNTAGKWGACPLTGSKFSYAGPTAVDGGPMSQASGNVDIAAQNWDFVAAVEPAGYAGVGLSFDQCANVTTFTGIQFTLLGTTGGCLLQLQLQTFDQKPTTETPAGGCDSTTTTCHGYPVATNLPTPTDATTKLTVMVPFSSLTGWTTTTAAEVVGLQWQLTDPPGVDGGAQTLCSADVRIDDVKLLQ